MQSHFTLLDGAVLAAYFLATMAVGFYFWRKSRTPDGFTAASHSLPGWACGLSIFATFLSSITFLGLPGKVAATNWNPLVFSLSLPLATWIAVRYFLPYYRASGEVSAYSHLEHRFGRWARVYAGLCYLLTQLARMGAVMYLMALPLNVLLGWDIRWVIVATGVSVTLYSFVGGIVAVIWTDAMQSIVLMAGAVACAAILVFSLPEGPGQLFTLAAAGDKFSLGGFGLDLGRPTFWVVLAYGLAINLQNFGIDQNYIQRYVASKSDREARKSLWLGGLLYLPVSIVFCFIGTALYAYYATHPGTLPEAYAGQTDYIFPYFIVTVLPPGVTGLLIAAVFAAAMSTVSTSLNSSATLVLTDYYKRYVRPQATDRQSMAVLYGSTIAWGAAGTGVALALAALDNKNILDAWWTLAGVFGGGMLGLFLLGMISRRARNAEAATAVLLGVLVIGWLTISTLPARWAVALGPLEPLRSPMHSFMTVVVGTLAILLVGLVATRLRRGKS